jgi:HlyD family secretion protein
VVTAVNVQVGQTAPATLPAMTLVDLSELQIVVNVDEIDVARLAEGQEVTIRLDALPDETVSGYVKHIAPAASQVGGVIVYGVTIVLGDTELPLRVGMSATAIIVIERLEDVLLVPNWAIRIDRDTGRTFVNLVREDTVEEIEVEIGVRGEDVSQVLAGLREGDVVVAGDVEGLRNLLERGE